jgi:hypothetical protein
MKRSLTVEFKRVIAVIGVAGMKVISDIDTYRLCAVLFNDVFRGHTRHCTPFVRLGSGKLNFMQLSMSE